MSSRGWDFRGARYRSARREPECLRLCQVQDELCSNLTFIKEDARRIASHGNFDAIFCCGLFYHLDKPREFLQLLASATSRLLILQTHFSTDGVHLPSRVLAKFPALAQKVLLKALASRVDHFSLSRQSVNEGLRGRWFTEFPDNRSFAERETRKWSAWDNRRSFWVQREFSLAGSSGCRFRSGDGAI